MVATEDRFKPPRPVPDPPYHTNALPSTAKVIIPKPLVIQMSSDSDTPLSKRPGLASEVLPTGPILDGSLKSATASIREKQNPRIGSIAMPAGQVPSGSGISATASAMKEQSKPTIITSTVGKATDPRRLSKASTSTPTVSKASTTASTLNKASDPRVQRKLSPSGNPVGKATDPRKQTKLPSSVEMPVQAERVLHTLVALGNSLPPISPADINWRKKASDLVSSYSGTDVSNGLSDWNLGVSESIQPSSLYLSECPRAPQIVLSTSANPAGSTGVDTDLYSSIRQAAGNNIKKTPTPPTCLTTPPIARFRQVEAEAPTLPSLNRHPTSAVIGRRDIANVTTNTSLPPLELTAATTGKRPTADAAMNTSSPPIVSTVTIAIQTTEPQTSNAATETPAYKTIYIDGYAFNVPGELVEYFHVMSPKIVVPDPLPLDRTGTLGDFHVVWSCARKRAAGEMEEGGARDLEVEEGRVVKRWKVDIGNGKAVDRGDGDEDFYAPKD
ncbi:hypothetical protein DFP73DRAFT_587383 [Morchella snyderi]|nr:hypothetical protein DFP73DRAFT_587383 [Morchella snyderi]